MKTIVNNILNKLEEVNLIGENPFLGADAMMSYNDIKTHSLSPIDRDVCIYISYSER